MKTQILEVLSYESFCRFIIKGKEKEKDLI